MENESISLEGKTALVTGASRGIGREIALAIGRAGARVNLVARSRDGLEETRRLLGQADSEMFCVDLRDEQAVDKLAEIVHSRSGSVDILANVAGVWHDHERKYHGPRLAQIPRCEIHEVLDVGLLACFSLSRLFVPGMMQKRSGKILQISCGFAGPHEAVGWLHYYVVNKALEAFTRGLAAELREYEVQANCIAPWFVATEAVKHFYPNESKKALDPCEVAKLATFLVSSRANNISGQVIELRSSVDYGDQ